MAIGRTDYKERKERRINGYEEKAGKANATAEHQAKKSLDALEGIVPGQPILVGHHSEGKHRAAIKRSHIATRKSVEEREKAEYYTGKAAAAESNNSISGDDPEAVTKYKDKLAKLEALQERMKAANLYWRKHKTMKGYPGLSDKAAAQVDDRMKTACTWVQKAGPYEDYRLKNNSAEIRRIKAKLETMQKLDCMAEESITFPGGEMRINLDNNRVQFVFDTMPPDEIRTTLKSNGFKWARSEGVWQRQRTLNAIHVAKRLIAEFAKGGEGD